MKPVNQTIFGPDDGNCLTAAIASVLELPLAAVPDFVKEHGDAHMQALTAWLLARGFRLLEIGFAEHTTFLNTYFAPPSDARDVWCILSGPSSYPDRMHTVVGRINEDGGIDVAHDPSPGHRGPLDGYRWVRFIVPLSAKEHSHGSDAQ